MSATSVFFPLIPSHPKDDPDATVFREVEIKFGINSGREIERIAGCSFNALLNRTQEIEAIVLGLCAGLRHSHKTINADKAADMVQAFVDADGDILDLYNAIIKAWNVSGVYGKRKPEETEQPAEDEGSADPPLEASKTM